MLQTLETVFFFILVDPGTVIAGATLAYGVLKDVLGALGNVDRKISIGIDNESGFLWKRPRIYFYSGSADKNLPYYVIHGKSEFSICRGSLV